MNPTASQPAKWGGLADPTAGQVVDLDAWVPTVSALVERGADYLELLTAVERSDHVEVVACVVSSGECTFVHTRVPHSSPYIASLTGILPAAAWHEREIHEMFGVSFVDHPDLRPLLLVDGAAQPLRKEVVLSRRVDTTWPGAIDDPTKRARRPSLPLGVPKDRG